ncbi:MAG: hypothetical protein WEE89_21550 [Gemmatimonadota bacterium]
MSLFPITVRVAPALLLLASSGAFAQNGSVLVDIRDLSPRELRSEGFVLESPQRLLIEAAGAAEKRGTNFFAREENTREWRGNAWILNARTREVVWELRQADGRRNRRDLEQFDGEISLPAGEYEAFYASYSALWRSEGNPLRWLIGGRNRDGYDDDGLSENFRMNIQGNGRGLAPLELQRLRDRYRSNAIFTLTSATRAGVQQIGFELMKATPVEIYAVGEAREDGAFDYGWIIDANTGKKVWSFDYARSRHAGGALKNRVVRVSRTLPAGRYAAIFAADDSHDPSEWNAAPPFDPSYWGLTVRVPAEDRASIKTFAYDPTPDDLAIVALTRMRNQQTRSQGFKLLAPMDVRIYALGEGTDGAMHDFGWIIDAKTRRRVWVMDYVRTEHAGGAEKNRLVNQVVRLEPGSYMVYFQTDGSHAFRSWNSGAPAGEDDWGISLFPASGTLDREQIAAFDENADDTGDVIARINNVGNDEVRSRTFTLERDSDVRLYAIGEGDGQMFDYAWIENSQTGRTVWEMTYRMTEHAGGADKNRRYDGVIRLPAGQYSLRYKSDDSHSPDSWNSDPPFDPSRWGVTVYRVTAGSGGAVRF